MSLLLSTNNNNGNNGYRKSFALSTTTAGEGDVVIVKDPVDDIVQEVWLESPGLGIGALHAAVQDRIGPAAVVSKARIKAAKALIPYRFVMTSSATTMTDEDERRRAFIVQKIQERQSLRNARRCKEADFIHQGLTGMGVVIDDIYKTWTIDEEKVSPLTITAPLTTAENDGIASPVNGVPCQMCGHFFASRNLLFQHLRDPGNGCGNAIFASGNQLPAAPSTVDRQKHKTKQQPVPQAPGRTARHAPALHSVWLGDLPLAWTRPTGKYKRLRALLFAQLPRTIPEPWIKKVCRKAYRCKVTDEYLGFAIVVFRDKGEATLARTALDGRLVTAESIFREWTTTADKHNSQQQEQQQTDYYAQQQQSTPLPNFCLKARPVKNSDSATSATAWSDNNKVATQDDDHEGGQDPPLIEQLRPLPLSELYRRIDRLVDRDGSSIPKGREEPTDKATYLQHHQTALEQLVDLMPEPRREERVQGRPIPESLSQRLLELLQTIKWPARNERPRLTSQRYMVLPTNVAAKDRFYGDLRQACRALMDWADPSYYYSGIAVTHNFVASPHMDVKDQTFQYAVALGNFTGGGQLCVERSTSPDDGEEVVQVIHTKNCLAKLDGRHVHWVRTWDQGDRFSLIFFDTRGN